MFGRWIRFPRFHSLIRLPRYGQPRQLEIASTRIMGEDDAECSISTTYTYPMFSYFNVSSTIIQALTISFCEQNPFQSLQTLLQMKPESVISPRLRHSHRLRPSIVGFRFVSFGLDPHLEPYWTLRNLPYRICGLGKLPRLIRLSY